VNRFRAAWSVLKSWGSPQSSQSLVQILQGIGARDGDFDALTDVAKIATIYRAVERIAFDLASCPLVIERKSGKDKWTPLDEDDPAFGNVAGVFKKANRREGKTSLWVRFHQSAELTGQAFLLTDYQNFGSVVLPGSGAPGSTPKSLRVLRADKTEAVFGNDRTDPIAYRFIPDGGQVQNLRLEEVLDHRYPHPREDWCGLSPALAAQAYTKIEDELSTYQRTFIRQGARGSVLLSPTQTLNEDQIAQLKREWNANNAGTRNVGGIWVANGGMKAQELNGRRDTDFVDLFRIVKEQVSSVFGVPPVFLGDFSNASLANINEQTPIYVEGTLMSKGTLLEESLTELVLPRFDVRGTLRARLDWDKVPMVQRMNVAKMVSFASIEGKLMTREEIRVANKLPPEPEPGMGEFAPPLDPNLAFAEPGEAKPPKPKPKDEEKKAAPRLVRKWIDDPARHAKRATAKASIERLEAAGVRDFRAYFRGLQERLLEDAGADVKAFATKAEPGDLLDEQEELAIVQGIVARIYTRVYASRGPDAMEQAGVEGSLFDLDDPRVQAFVRDNAYRNGKRITGTLAGKVRDLLSEHAVDGRSIQELADDLIDLCGELRRSHALTIARTETVRAYNASSIEGWRQSGIVAKSAWLTAQDDAVRDSHAALDGETVTLGAPFSNGLQFPGDPSGPPEETINCRCTLEPVADEGEGRSTRVATGFIDRLRKGLTAKETAAHPLASSLNGKGSHA
jgi:HK97 family phage portal protein